MKIGFGRKRIKVHLERGNGYQRNANKQVKPYADSFERSSSKGLFGFVRKKPRIQVQQSDTLPRVHPTLSHGQALGTEAEGFGSHQVLEPGSVNGNSVSSLDCQRCVELTNTDLASEGRSKVQNSTKTSTPVSEHNRPSPGWLGLKGLFSEKKGFTGGIKSIREGKWAAGLGEICRAIVSLPFHALTAALDAPRKLADMASTKGRDLVERGENQGGVGGWFRSLGGGLLQFLSGPTRLLKPLIGTTMVLAGAPMSWIPGAVLGVFFGSGPIGIAAGAAVGIAGLVILAIYFHKEVSYVVSDRINEMQIYKALRDMAGGAGSVLGSFIAPALNSLKKLFTVTQKQTEVGSNSS